MIRRSSRLIGGLLTDRQTTFSAREFPCRRQSGGVTCQHCLAERGDVHLGPAGVTDLIKLAKLLCQLAVLLSIRLNFGRDYGLVFYRIYHHLRDWGMLEVYFMGVLVAIVKLVDLAELTVGLGLFCFISLLLIQVWLEVVMSPHQIWSALSGEDLHAGD